MYDNTEIRVLEQIYLRPGIHKRELAKMLSLSMPSIDYSLKKLNRFVLKHHSGNQIQYSLNYATGAITPFLYAVEYRRLEKLPLNIKRSLREFIKELKEKPLLSILFGSYVSGRYTSSSDVDILLVFQKLDKPQEIEKTARIIGLRTNVQINAVYLDYPSFSSSFHLSTKEFFRNLRENKLLLVGIEWWRLLLDEES